jgi:hypothetical protein
MQQNKSKDNVFEKNLHQICIIDGLCKFLLPLERVLWEEVPKRFIFLNDVEELHNLLACNRKIKDMLTNAFISIFAVRSSTILTWKNKEKRKRITYLYVDDITFFVNRQIINFKLKEIVFDDTFNRTITMNTFATTLLKIKFGSKFNRFLDKGVFPNSLTHLTFGFHFNQPLDEGTLPTNLEYLEFGFCFEQTLYKNILPNKLRRLVFNSRYIPLVCCLGYLLRKNIFPENLKKITLDNRIYSLEEIKKM